MPDHDSYSLKEMFQLLREEIKEVNSKQDQQLENQAETRVALQALPPLRAQVDDLVDVVKNPEKGLVRRIGDVELHLKAQDRTALANASEDRSDARSSVENKRSLRNQIIAAIVGSLSLVALTCLVCYFRWAH